MCVCSEIPAEDTRRSADGRRGGITVAGLDTRTQNGPMPGCQCVSDLSLKVVAYL